MQLIRITRDTLAQWQPELEALEQRSVYPLGDDAFRISHGRDYFAFFERLGDVRYYAWQHENELVAVGCGVLRPATPSAPARWYLGDVKVRPDHRGRHLPIAMLRRAFLSNWLRCGRGYAIAMNPADGSEPPGARLVKHFGWIPPSLMRTQQLHIYSADTERTRAALPMLSSTRRGRPHFVSLLGIKDLVLESTKKPLSLLHAKYGDAVDERWFREPQKGSAHMWCTLAGSQLDVALRQNAFAPSATATLISHRLASCDWSALDTSEI